MALVAGGLAMYSAVTTEEGQMLDARLEQLGATIVTFVDEEMKQSGRLDRRSPEAPLKTRPAAATLYRYQVWTNAGVLVLHSHEAPNNRPMIDLAQLGFADSRVGDEDFRTFSLPSRDGRFVVQVSENLGERVEQVGMVTLRYVAFLVLPFALILVATWLLLRRSLKSIRSIAFQLADRNPLDVSRLCIVKPPEELMPILKSLDALFGRIGHAISVERRFTSVAAHEMRTPLSGLRAHAQLALSARNEEELQDALHAVVAGVDRASHMLGQLLDIARVDGVSKEGSHGFRKLDLALVCANACSEIHSVATEKSVAIRRELAMVHMSGLPFGLYLVARNLLANAVLYTPPGGVVRISTSIENRHAVLVVDDSGPGIPAQDRERAFERFNRLGQHETDGVGLGLSIVLMVVELHDAKVTLLDSPLGGLRCQIVFAMGASPVETTDLATLATA